MILKVVGIKNTRAVQKVTFVVHSCVRVYLWSVGIICGTAKTILVLVGFLWPLKKTGVKKKP